MEIRLLRHGTGFGLLLLATLGCYDAIAPIAPQVVPCTTTDSRSPVQTLFALQH